MYQNSMTFSPILQYTRRILLVSIIYLLTIRYWFIHGHLRLVYGINDCNSRHGNMFERSNQNRRYKANMVY